MKKKFSQASALTLILGSAVFLILAFLLKGISGFVGYKIMTHNDSMQVLHLSAQDFALSGIEQTGENSYITTDGDPQMTANINTKVCCVKFYAEYDTHPGEIVAYYTKNEQQGFSARKRLFFKPVDGLEGWYEAETAFKNIYNLRIDPTMYQGVNMQLGEFVINGEKNLGDWLNVGYGDIYYFVIYTGIISSCLKMIQLLLKRDLE